MIRVTIRRQGSTQDELQEFTLRQITLGRVERNHVVLANNRVSSVHARVIENEEGIVLVDNNSTNGTFVNGELVRGPVVLSPQDTVDIGIFTLHFEHADDSEAGAYADQGQSHEYEGGEIEPSEFDELQGEPEELGEPPSLLATPAEPTPADPVYASDMGGPAPLLESVGPAGSGAYRLTPTEPEPEPAQPPPPARPSQARPSRRTTELDVSAQPAPKTTEEGLALAFRQTLEALLGEPPGPQAHVRALAVAREAVERCLTGLDPRQRRQWTDWIAHEVSGTGPITDILSDPSVSEVLVAGNDWIEVRRGETRSRHPARFSCEQAVNLAIERLLGTRPTAGAPIIDGRTEAGVSVHVVARPIAAAGPIVTLSRPAGEATTLLQLAGRGALSEPAAELLASSLQRGLNMLVCATSRADLGPLVGALAGELPAERRVVAVHRAQVPPALASRAIVLDAGRDPTAVVRSAVRMRPDWLFVQDLGGAETAELCAAARRTAGSTIAVVTAEGVEAGLDRLQAMLALAAPDAAAPRLRAYVAGCFDLVIAVRRSLTGRDLVVSIAEIRRARGEVVELFTREDDEGALASTGVSPSLL